MERTDTVIERDKELTEDDIEKILQLDVKSILVKVEDRDGIDYSVIYNTLKKDTSNNSKEAVEYIYRQLRNAEPPDEETARGIIEKLFFSDKRYDLGRCGSLPYQHETQSRYPRHYPCPYPDGYHSRLSNI